MRPLIEVRTAGGPGIGMGHVRRSSALARVLKDRGHRIRFPESSGTRSPWLSELPEEAGEPAILLFDTPFEIAEEVALARRAGIRTVALDYFGGGQPDLTISIRERDEHLPPGRRLAGLEYAIIRHAVRACASRPRTGGVLVVLGGADVRGEGPTVSAELARRGEPVTLVVGPFARAQPDGPGPEGVVVVYAPEDLPQLMAAATWAVANGGVTMMELLYVGTPTHVVPQTEPERALAQVALDAGALLGIGRSPIVTPAAEVRARVADAARKLIDGMGAERICAEIEGLL